MWGDFVLPEKDAPVLLVAAGIGVTPFVSQLAAAERTDAVPMLSARGTFGNRTVNTVEPGSLATVIVPWWAVTMALAIERPRPVPPVCRAREASARENRSNSSSATAGSIPGPSSATRSTATPSCTATLAVTCTPSGVCTRAFVSRFAITWCRRVASPATTTGSSGTSMIHSWSGPATCASVIASTTTRVRSTAP